MKKLDERQQLLQGKIFKHTVVIMAILLFMTAFLVNYGYNIAEGMWSYVLIVVVAVVTGLIEMIWRDVFTFNEEHQIITFGIIGILGIILIIMTVIDMINLKSSLITQNSLSESGANLVMGILYIGVIGSFTAKKIIGKKKMKEGDKND